MNSYFALTQAEATQAKSDPPLVMRVLADIAGAKCSLYLDGNREYATTNGIRIQIDDPFSFIVLIDKRSALLATHDDPYFGRLRGMRSIDITMQR
ncbi:hypothetical protein XF14_10825 [Burkholderia gladioli]|nr:hypothetical protein XF14_10825 [Burkholderia gladioli]